MWASARPGQAMRAAPVVTTSRQRRRLPFTRSPIECPLEGGQGNSGYSPMRRLTLGSTQSTSGNRTQIEIALTRQSLRARPICPGELPRGAEAARDLGPVNDVPPRVDVVRAPVLVLEVVGVLPDVHAEERGLPVGDRRVLVGRGDDRESGAVVHEP